MKKILFLFSAVSFLFTVTTQAQGTTTPTDYRKIPSVVAETFDQKNNCSFAFSQAERPDSITRQNELYTFFYKKYDATVINISESDYQNYRILRQKKDEVEKAVNNKKEQE